MGFDLRPTCAKCAVVLDISNMRTVDGKQICRSCFEDSPEQNIASPRSEPNLNFNELFPPRTYQCLSCDFVFQRKITANVTRCPYCAKQTVEPQEKDTLPLLFN